MQKFCASKEIGKSNDFFFLLSSLSEKERQLCIERKMKKKKQRTDTKNKAKKINSNREKTAY